LKLLLQLVGNGALLQAMTATTTAEPARTTGNVIVLPQGRLGRMPKDGNHGTGPRRQRFRILPFTNSSGSRSWRVQGQARDGHYHRENYVDVRKAEARRLELEQQYILGAAAEIELPRLTILSTVQLEIAQTAFKELHHVEAADSDLLSAVSAWIHGGRQRANATAPRLDDAISQFKEWVQQTPKLRTRSKANLLGRITVFSNSVPNIRLDAITPEFLETYLDGRNTSAIAKDSEKRAVSRFLSWCGERPRRWITGNPAIQVHVDLPKDKAVPVVLSVQECERLLRASENYRDGLMVPYIALCLIGGVRPAEVSRLTWDNVHLSDSEIRIESAVAKTGRSRVVPIHPTLKSWLTAYKIKPIIPGSLPRHFKKLRRLAKIGKWAGDCMRHTAISHACRVSKSYIDVAKTFGNSEQIIRGHYEGRVSSADAAQFYALRPRSKRK
jgi:integrase